MLMLMMTMLSFIFKSMVKLTSSSQVRVVSKDPKKFGGCSLWQAQATVQMCVTPPPAVLCCALCIRSSSDKLP
jgi:hypothetical protein